jgi:hypothetical protein
MTTPSDHVPVAVAMNAPGVASVALELPWGSEDDPLWTPRPASAIARDSAYGGKGRLRKKASSLVALAASGDLVVRRALAEKALAGAPPGEIGLVPVALHDAEGLVADDFVLIDPRPWLPMDRAASEAIYVDEARPEGSPCDTVRRLAWGPERAPRHAAFRLAEHPHVALLRRDLAEALVKATKKGVVIVEPPYPTDVSMTLGPQAQLLRQVGVVGVAELAPAPPEADAARAAGAFWALYAGQRDEALRRAACASPMHALAVARSVDGGPRDDTRRGALGDPRAALLYAIQIDAGPRDDTREAAARADRTALAYAKYVDHGPHPVTRRGASATDAKDYDARGAKAARIAAALAGDGAPPKGPPPAARLEAAAPAAPRSRPAHEAPRYAEDHGPDAPPTHAPLEPGLRSDVDAFVGHGLGLVDLAADAPPERVVAAIDALVASVQRKERKLAKKKHAVMALGCALGDAVHRALGWSWAMVKDRDGTGGVAVVAPDRAAALYPLAIAERLLAPKGKGSTTALTLAMLAAGDLPPGAKPGAYAAIV